MENNKYFTIQEFAELMKVSHMTVRRWFRNIESPLPVLKIGKTYRIPRVEADRWLKNQFQETRKIFDIGEPILK